MADAFDQTGYKQWTWAVSGKDSSAFTGHSVKLDTTNHCHILTLTSSRLVIYDSTYRTLSYETVIGDTMPMDSAQKTTLSLLAAKQWKYDTLYFHYIGPGTGYVVYARGSNDNIQDWDNNRFVQWPNGTQDVFLNDGSYLPTTWAYNGSSTAFISSYSSTNAHAHIISIDSTHQIVVDSTDHAYEVESLKP